MVRSGAQRAQKERTAAAVAQFPGKTSMELARATGLDRHMVARRLPELVKEGRVYRGAAVRCRISEKAACTWWPVAPGQNLSLGI